MIWSLTKVLIFVAAVTALTVGAAWLMEVPGAARITVAGVEVTLSALELAIGFVLLVLLVWIGLYLLGLLVAILRFINGDETAISRYFTRNRQRRGFEALSEGMMALASGEPAVAMARAQRAERLLNRPDLTTVLVAQAAEQAGDRKKAEAAYKALLGDDRTRFVGVRGLMKQKLAEGDTETALQLARKAFQMKPRNGEVQDILLRLQAESHDWAGARATLGAELRSGRLPREVYRRRDAILALSEAKEILAETSSVEAREEAIEANRLSPDLIPAAVLAARSYIAAGNPKYAARVLKKTWDVNPHPDIAAAFAEIVPDESPRARLKRFELLTKSRPDHPETRMLLAELLIAAEDFPAARRALGDLPEVAPTARNLALIAAVERGQGADEAVVRGWLTRALTAPRGPQWVCDNCGQVHAVWQPICTNCHGFDTLSWKEPPAAQFRLPGGTDMLPLLAGTPKPPAPEPPAEPPQEGEVLPPAIRPS